MKKLLKVTALTVALGFTTTAMAQENVGLVNVEYLYSHHPDRETAFQKLEMELKAPAEKLQAEEKALADKKKQFTQEIENKLKALEKDAPNLKQAQIKNRQEEISALAQKREEELKTLADKFQQKVMAFESESKQAQMAANKRLLKEIQLATNEVAKMKNYTLVLDEKAAVFAQDGKDITQDVLKSLEKKAK